MSYSKRQFVETAYEEIGIADYDFDLSPEQLNSGVRRLDGMMTEWNGRGIRLGYPVPGSPEDTDLDAPTVVPNWAWEAVYLNLALRIAPMVGKDVSPDTKTNAFRAYNTVMGRSLTIPQVQMPATMPAGAGSRWRGVWGNYVIPPQNQSIPTPEDDVTFSN
jgi:predicted NBD/HSP70 family sugar kinase